MEWFFNLLHIHRTCEAKETIMQQFFSYLPKTLAIAAISIALSCNNSDQSDDNDGQGDVTTNHDVKGDTSMIDTTRTATSGQGNDVETAMTDPGFVSKNIKDNLMEIHMSKMGRDKGTDEQLKKNATQMVADHTQMLSELKAAAQKKGFPASEQPVDMSAMPTLSDKSGREFDMIWVGQMRTMHEAKVQELQNFINTTQDADLKALATKAIGKIKMHRDSLNKIKSGAQ